VRIEHPLAGDAVFRAAGAQVLRVISVRAAHACSGDAGEAVPRIKAEAGPAGCGGGAAEVWQRPGGGVSIIVVDDILRRRSGVGLPGEELVVCVVGHDGQGERWITEFAEQVLDRVRNTLMQRIHPDLCHLPSLRTT
jgi:hypothetical protein